MRILLRRKNDSPFHIPYTNHSRRSEYISVCAWCGKIRVGDDWLDLGEAVGKLELFDLSALPRLSHGVCHVCRVELKKEVEESRAKHNKTMSRS